MKDIFEKYLRSLSEDRAEKTELSDRGALETLLKAAAKDAGPGIRVIHEAKKVRGKGGPDFKVMKAARYRRGSCWNLLTRLQAT